MFEAETFRRCWVTAGESAWLAVLGPASDATGQSHISFCLSAAADRLAVSDNYGSVEHFRLGMSTIYDRPTGTQPQRLFTHCKVAIFAALEQPKVIKSQWLLHIRLETATTVDSPTDFTLMHFPGRIRYCWDS